MLVCMLACLRACVLLRASLPASLPACLLACLRAFMLGCFAYACERVRMLARWNAKMPACLPMLACVLAC